MEFNGFLKLTLLDYPTKTACTLFTKGCNFRCPFCHNASLVLPCEPHERYSEEEVLRFLEKRQGILDGVCVTGGEPLLHSSLDRFLEQVKALGYAVKLDTNGSNPDRLKNLIERGLVDHVAMDIKNTPEKYGMTVGLEEFDVSPILESIALLSENRVSYEFRTTVVAEYHTVQDIGEIARMLQGAPAYYLQNFVDSGDLIGQNLHAVSRETLDLMRFSALEHLQNVELRGV
ncbi:MAG: anaerobic ribonucleoside-triphosphate reductase activating protein [Ruminococcaceae bacterium]|nr:anaerobic ribonucleoside-triphosphate reductase activating protein [Oscillospiraceae bacterium]